MFQFREYRSTPDHEPGLLRRPVANVTSGLRAEVSRVFGERGAEPSAGADVGARHLYDWSR